MRKKGGKFDFLDVHLRTWQVVCDIFVLSQFKISRALSNVWPNLNLTLGHRIKLVLRGSYSIDNTKI